MTREFKYWSTIKWIAVGVSQKDDNDSESVVSDISVWTTESARGPLYGGGKPSHWLTQLDVANKVKVIKGEWRKRCRIKGGVQWFRQKVKQEINHRGLEVSASAWVCCRKPTSPLSLSACCLSGLLLGRGLQLYGLWEGTLNTSSPFQKYPNTPW